jgi:hypothetical protein
LALDIKQVDLVPDAADMPIGGVENSHRHILTHGSDAVVRHKSGIYWEAANQA